MSSKQAQFDDIGTGARDLLAVGNILGDSGIPEKYPDMSFHRNRASLKLTIKAEAWQNAGVDIDNPDAVTQYYFEDSGVLIVDLGGRFTDE